MTDKLPAALPANGNLPATYEAAQRALSECSRVDEVKDWADKAAALASYAKQAKDHTLLHLAQRIQARAVRRCGELLRQVDPLPGARTDLGTVPTRGSAAADAGLSERQRKTALRIANIPSDEFEASVENTTPLTVSELAIRGTLPRQQEPAPAPIPADPVYVAQAITLLRQLAAFCASQDAKRIARAPELDAAVLRNYVGEIDRWLDRFITNLPSEEAA